MNVYILAAGLGERLRPITEQIPKPLLPILGRPVIDYVLEKVAPLNPLQICVNLHYKANQILDWLKGHRLSEKIVTYYEPEILGTGGCLWNARDLLSKSGIFLTYNADILCDLSLKKLLESHQGSQNIATLAVIDHPSVNSLCLEHSGHLLKVNEIHCCHLKRTFTGIAVYSSGFLGFLTDGPLSVVDGWIKAIEAGYRIGTFDITGYYWSDIGSPQGYANTVFDMLQQKGETVHIDSSIKDCRNLTCEGRVVIEWGCNFKVPVRIKDSIVMPNTTIDIAINADCQIIGNGYKLAINTDSFGVKLGFGGSDRTFHRVVYKGQRAIEMKTTGDDPDFERHIEYSHFFKKRGLPVPEVLEVRDHTAFFEDLGDLSIYNWLRCKRGDREIIDIYKKVIDALVSLHSLNLVDDYPHFRDFDYKYFRWETDYFLEEFVMGYLGIQSVTAQVLSDLDRLARKAASLKKAIIHRDLQSQNIMIRGDGSIAFIDYQGARFGPPAYDVASLCYDPYVDLGVTLRERLCNMYMSTMADLATNFDPAEFERSLKICRLQRLMQALGAYAYLSRRKGKPHFLKYIPSALMLLRDSAAKIEDQFLDLRRFLETITQISLPF